MSEIVLCGATGDLGGRIAVRLAERRIPFRALVRPHSDTTALRAAGVELSVGDLTDPPGLDRALAGVRTVVTTANGIGRSLPGRGTSPSSGSTATGTPHWSGPPRRPASSGSCSSPRRA